MEKAIDFFAVKFCQNLTHFFIKKYELQNLLLENSDFLLNDVTIYGINN